MNRGVSQFVQVLTGSLLTLSVQGSAIVLLTPTEYGVFALFYLVFGLGTAAVYAIVAEAWARATMVRDDWGEYSSVLLRLSLVSAIPVALIAGIVGDWLLGVAFATSIIASLYRGGARYFAVALRLPFRVVPADIASFVVFWAVALPMTSVAEPSGAVAWAWAAAAISGAALSGWPTLDLFTLRLSTWVRSRWSEIRYLAADAGLLELGSAGVPLLLTPFMGLAGFGVYRAVTSVAVPVRLIVNPLRPTIATTPLAVLLGIRFLVGAGLIGLIAGGTAFFCLMGLATLPVLASSTLTALSPLALPVAIYVGLNFPATIFYVALRTKSSGARLLRYRLVQLLLAVGVPIGGFVLGGLAGAVWSYPITSAVMLVVSLTILSGGTSSRAQ